MILLTYAVGESKCNARYQNLERIDIMPFGQSFWVGQIVRRTVESVTGDPMAGKVVGKTAKWITAAVTHDWHTAIIDEVAENFVEEGAETLIEEATENVFDESVDTFYESSIEHADMLMDDTHHASFRDISSSLHFRGLETDDAPLTAIFSTPDEVSAERLESFLHKVLKLDMGTSYTALAAQVQDAANSGNQSAMVAASKEVINQLGDDRKLGPLLTNLIHFAGYGKH